MRGLVAVLVLVVALTGSSFAADLVTLDSIRVAVNQQNNHPDSGNTVTSVPRLVTIINRAASQVCRDFNAYAKMDTVIINNTMESGTLNTDFLRLHQVFRMVGDTVRLPLKILFLADSLPFIHIDLPKSTQNKQSKLSPDQVFSVGRMLLTSPKISKASTDPDSFLVVYWADPPEMTTGTDTTKVLPGFREHALLYALSQVAKLRNRFSEAQSYKAEYDALVAKEGVSR